MLISLNIFVKSFSEHFRRLVVWKWNTLIFLFFTISSIDSRISNKICYSFALISSASSRSLSMELTTKPLKTILRTDSSGQALVDYHKYSLNLSFMCCLYFSKYPYPHTWKDSSVKGTRRGSICLLWRYS